MKLLRWFAAVVVAFSLMMGAMYVRHRLLPSASLLFVPRVAGMTQDGAYAALASAGFTHEVRVCGSHSPAVRTDPPAGAHVRKGANITLYMQDGETGCAGQSTPVPFVVTPDATPPADFREGGHN